MNHEEIKSIEESLDLRLPERYRRFLLNYPRELVRMKEIQPFGLVAPGPSKLEFYDNAKQLIDTNRRLREPGTEWMEDGGHWPEKFFAIGENMCGDYWAINILDTRSLVWAYDHEIGKFIGAGNFSGSREGPLTLEQFTEEVLKQRAEFNKPVSTVPPRLRKLHEALRYLDSIPGERLTVEQYMQIQWLGGWSIADMQGPEAVRRFGANTVVVPEWVTMYLTEPGREEQARGVRRQQRKKLVSHIEQARELLQQEGLSPIVPPPDREEA